MSEGEEGGGGVTNNPGERAHDYILKLALDIMAATEKLAIRIACLVSGDPANVHQWSVS